ncbi:hypothetical protein Asulf_02174 [Archaeoglobus sulfaticallidus PM70-1]|uniref:Uncharacterized protein n=1 Tax=Archaeoglobus sulfaticallidus PM70-1 TaxID=387631 RepID=N0BIJ1_9EURY|nr:hypothetical protein [Archaeoglobus sulfaticallidus]AGK62127.1 hypothetical protein Asulf_02174 [Archaeoglobus sulfaticallidus PM70-1]
MTSGVPKSSKKEILLALWKCGNGEMDYATLFDVLKNKMRMNIKEFAIYKQISQEVNDEKSGYPGLEDMGCVKIRPRRKRRERHVIEFKNVDWNVLRCVVEVFENYKGDYVELMHTDFGNLVIDFLKAELDKLKNAFSDEIRRLLILSSSTKKTYLERHIGDLLSNLDPETMKKVNELSKDLIKLLNISSERNSDTSFLTLFNQMKGKAIMSLIDSPPIWAILSTVKYSHEALKFFVLCNQGKYSDEEVWEFAKLGLFFVSIPPVLHIKYKGNIHKFFKDLGNSVGIDDRIGKEIINLKEDIQSKLTDYDGFSVPLACFGVSSFYHPDTTLFQKIDRGLWEVFNALGLIYLKEDLLVEKL